MVKQIPKEFEAFLEECDQQGVDPFSRMRRNTHEKVDQVFGKIEEKYRQGREGKTWADLADEAYDDVKEGWNQITKEAADWYYGNN